MNATTRPVVSWMGSMSRLLKRLASSPVRVPVLGQAGGEEFVVGVALLVQVATSRSTRTGA